MIHTNNTNATANPRCIKSTSEHPGSTFRISAGSIDLYVTFRSLFWFGNSRCRKKRLKNEDKIQLPGEFVGSAAPREEINVETFRQKIHSGDSLKEGKLEYSRNTSTTSDFCNGKVPFVQISVSNSE